MQKFFKRHSYLLRFSGCSSIINCKDKTKIQKTLTDTNTRLKNFCMQKGISFIDTSGIKEFYLGKRKLHLNKKGNGALAKTY